MERIEHHLDAIVVVDIFTARHAGTHQIGAGVEGYENDVNPFIRIAEINDGGFGCGCAVFRVLLYESLDFRHLAFDGGGGLHVEEVLQGRRDLHVGDADAFCRWGSGCGGA